MSTCHSWKTRGLFLSLTALWALSNLSFGACATLSQANSGGDVHIELNDGQVIVGALATPTFVLKTELGTMRFDTFEAGELGPLEGSDMKQSDNLVRLWLRNGSEFIGAWEKPAVEMKLRIGDQDVALNIPIDKLKRLRFRGQPLYSERPLYRVLSRSGDDFFVEADRSKIHFLGEMGPFSPYLAELQSLKRLDAEDNTWQVQLKNGTVLHASIEESGLELRPALGPDRLKLSWKQMARVEPAAMPNRVMAPVEQASSQPYYDNTAQRAMKAEAAASWK